MKVVFVFLHILVLLFCFARLSFAQQDELNFSVADSEKRLIDEDLNDSIFYFMEDAIKSPLRVEQLFIDGKQLSSLPLEVMKFKNLKVLDISHNKIVDLPDSLFSACPSLIEIRYAGNELKTIPLVLCTASLQTLDLSENYLTSLDNCLSKCLSLEELDLHANDIAILPTSSVVLKNLKSFILSENPIKKLDDWIFNQPQLKILFLDNTQLDVLPASICKASHLKLLNIEDNKLNTIPDCLCQMKGIKVMMMMEGNNFEPLIIDNLVKCLPQLKVR
jgi:hypothetical protein